MEMDSAACASTYGDAVAEVCQRLSETGWDPGPGAGWLSTLAAVMAGFVFSAIVLVLTPQSPFRGAAKSSVDRDHSLPVFLGSFLSLLSASFLLILVSSQLHPVKILPSVGLAAAVFGAGSVQTFVAIAWLAVESPRTSSALPCFAAASRFVMLATGTHVLVSVTKAQWIVTGEALQPWRIGASILLIGAPWVVTRALLRPGALVARWNGRLQVLSFKLSVSFVILASLAFTFVVDRGYVAPAAAFPDWLAFGTLFGLGLVYALHELNLPSLPVAHDLRRLSGADENEETNPSAGEGVPPMPRSHRREAMAGT
jgi:hypothetical protein